jgi:hypothetical protein
MTRRLAVVGVSVTLITAPPAAAPQLPEPTRVVYVTVTDGNGIPVDDLTAADFTVKEGGKTVRVTEAATARDPLQIALIVDDNGTGMFRVPLLRFVQRMEGRAAMSLSSVTGQTMRIVDYTGDVVELAAGLATLNARPGTPDGGQLLEGIAEAAVDLTRREARRPVIIALTVGGEEHSTATADHVLDQLRRSGAMLYVFSVVGSALRPTVAVTRPSALLQENMNLQKVLGDGPRQSGGRLVEIVPAAGKLADLPALASELLHQYRVSYTLPPGVRPSDRLAVSVTKKGLSVRAPTRIRNTGD